MPEQDDLDMSEAHAATLKVLAGGMLGAEKFAVAPQTPAVAQAIQPFDVMPTFVLGTAPPAVEPGTAARAQIYLEGKRSELAQALKRFSAITSDVSALSSSASLHATSAAVEKAYREFSSARESFVMAERTREHFHLQTTGNCEAAEGTHPTMQRPLSTVQHLAQGPKAMDPQTAGGVQPAMHAPGCSIGAEPAYYESLDLLSPNPVTAA